MTDAAAAAAVPAASPAPETLPLRIRLGWGLGSLPMSALSVTSSVLVLRFMTDTLGIAAGMASLMFSVAKLWDAVADPVVGAISDRTPTRWGKRLPWMLWGGLGCVIVIVGTFAVPVESATALALYMGASMLLFATAYAMFMIPYMAMPSEITSSYNGRTQLMSFRVVSSSLGSMVGLGLGPMLLATRGATRAGHLKMGAVIGAISALTVLACIWMLWDAPRGETVERRHAPMLQQIRSTFSNRPFMWLLIAKVLYYMKLAFSLTTFAYFTKHVMQVSDAWLGTLLSMNTVVLIAAQPLWLWVGRTFGKRNGFILAVLMFAAGSAWWWTAVPGEAPWLSVARQLVNGVAGGGAFLLTQAMLPDVMEYDRYLTGERREGMFAGVFVFIEKVAGALGVAFIGVFLQYMGYVKATGGVTVQQPQSAILGLYICTAILPAVFSVLAALAMLRYDLTPAKLEALRAGGTAR